MKTQLILLTLPELLKNLLENAYSDAWLDFSELEINNIYVHSAKNDCLIFLMVNIWLKNPIFQTVETKLYP